MIRIIVQLELLLLYLGQSNWSIRSILQNIDQHGPVISTWISAGSARKLNNQLKGNEIKKISECKMVWSNCIRRWGSTSSARDLKISL